jgi:hypothetical protein
MTRSPEPALALEPSGRIPAAAGPPIPAVTLVPGRTHADCCIAFAAFLVRSAAPAGAGNAGPGDDDDDDDAPGGGGADGNIDPDDDEGYDDEDDDDDEEPLQCDRRACAPTFSLHRSNSCYHPFRAATCVFLAVARRTRQTPGNRIIGF